jgi:uncharacterized protein YaiE (UPF0345 family)
MKKVLFGLTAMVFSGAALSADFDYELTAVTVGSANGESGGAVSKDIGYTISDLGIITQVSGTYGVTRVVYPAGTKTLKTEVWGGIVIDGSAGSATTVSSFRCVEGSFGATVGANICGNYAFGTNKVNESTINYGAGGSLIPGTRSINVNQASTFGAADDTIAGAQAQYTDYGCTIASGTAGSSDNIVCNTSLWNSAGTGGTSTAGTQLVFSHLGAAVPVPAAVWLFGSALGLLGWVRRRATV